jgi:hypothetical protein
LGNGGQRGAAGNAHQHAFFAGAAAGHLAGRFGVDLDHAVEQAVFRLVGMKPAPMPWIGCGAGAPPLITGDALGSTATP